MSQNNRENKTNTSSWLGTVCRKPFRTAGGFWPPCLCPGNMAVLPPFLQSPKKQLRVNIVHLRWCLPLLLLQAWQRYYFKLDAIKLPRPCLWYPDSAALQITHPRVSVYRTSTEPSGQQNRINVSGYMIYCQSLKTTISLGPSDSRI